LSVRTAVIHINKLFLMLSPHAIVVDWINQTHSKFSCESLKF